MIINDEWVYIRVPRTASSSMEAVLAPYHDNNYNKYSVSDYYKGDLVRGFDMHLKHFTIDHINKNSPEIIKDKIIFAFVRNPYDRIVSYYYFYKQKKAVGTFENFVLKFIRDKEKLSAYPFWYQQYKWLIIGDDITFNTIVFPFEKLEHYFRFVTTQLCLEDLYGKLPHKKKSVDKKDYREYYTDKSQLIVYENCKKDFELFGYKKEL